MSLTEIARFSISYLQIVNEEGQADERLNPRLGAETERHLYEVMTLARHVDERMFSLQRQGRLGTIPLCTGQEAGACGVALAMQPEDWFVGAYRELGARLLRGESLLQYLRYWNGYEEGNYQPERLRSLPVCAIIGSQLPHAVGLAYAMKYRQEACAVVAFFGDGATSQGDVHEAMNFAGAWHLPMVFICMNNQWAISHPVDRQTAAKTLAQKAIAYGFEGIQVDGNDVLAVYRAAKAALDRARSGGGPTLIEAVTYRLLMHTTADDPKRYRPEEEVESWRKRDPLIRFRKYLEARGRWTEKDQEELEARVREQINQAVAEFDAEFVVPPDAPFDHVYGESEPVLEAQRAEFLGHLACERSDA